MPSAAFFFIGSSTRCSVLSARHLWTEFCVCVELPSTDLPQGFLEDIHISCAEKLCNGGKVRTSYMAHTASCSFFSSRPLPLLVPLVFSLFFMLYFFPLSFL